MVSAFLYMLICASLLVLMLLFYSLIVVSKLFEYIQIFCKALFGETTICIDLFLGTMLYHFVEG